MTEEEFSQLVEIAKRGQTVTTGDLSADEHYALTLIATAQPWTRNDIDAAWAAHRGEAPFDELPIR